MSKGPDVFHYLDARQYLRDSYEYHRKSNPKFSFRYIGNKLGKKSSSYFSDILKGKTRFHDGVVTSLIKVMKLTAGEAEYFRFLCHYTQAKDAHEREHYLEKLVQLNRLPSKVLENSDFEFYGKWYHGALRALLDVMTYRGDGEGLGALLFPPISSRKAKESFQMLTKLGLINKDADGVWKPTDKMIRLGPQPGLEDQVSTMTARNYQLKCLGVMEKIIRENPPVPKKLMTETMSLSREAYKRIESKLIKFRNEVLFIVQGDGQPRESVYHLNMLLLPQSMKSPLSR